MSSFQGCPQAVRGSTVYFMHLRIIIVKYYSVIVDETEDVRKDVDIDESLFQDLGDLDDEELN